LIVNGQSQEKNGPKKICHPEEAAVTQGHDTLNRRAGLPV
jgi:hypothetical protein